MDVHAEMMGGGKRCSFSSESASLSLGDNISAAAAVGTIQEDGGKQAWDTLACFTQDLRFILWSIPVVESHRNQT